MPDDNRFESPTEEDFSGDDPKVRFVDLDSEVQVQSGINVGDDVDNRDEVLRAATCFMKSPNRALSARELSILMLNQSDALGDFGVRLAQEYIDALVEAGFLHEVNEPDDGYKRYRVV